MCRRKTPLHISQTEGAAARGPAPKQCAPQSRNPQKPTVCLICRKEVCPLHQPGRGAPLRAGCAQPGLENHRNSCYLIIPFLLQEEGSVARSTAACKPGPKTLS